MGGSGSGRRGGRNTTGYLLRLDVRQLQRAGVLTPGWRGGWQWTRRSGKSDIGIEAEVDHIRLRYTNKRNGESRDFDYTVRLSRSSCHYGGDRAWFICPAQGCGRRVAILYGGSVYACRHCHQLAYESQRETSSDRAIRRADAIRDRLKWEPGILNPDGWKPKGMHWRTFWRLKADHDQLKGAGMQAWAQQLGIMEGRIDKLRR